MKCLKVGGLCPSLLEKWRGDRPPCPPLLLPLCNSVPLLHFSLLLCSILPSKKGRNLAPSQLMPIWLYSPSVSVNSSLPLLLPPTSAVIKLLCRNVLVGFCCQSACHTDKVTFLQYRSIPATFGLHAFYRHDILCCTKTTTCNTIYSSLVWLWYTS